MKPQENNSFGVDGSVGDVAEKEEVVDSPKPSLVGYSPNEDELEELEQTEKDDEVKKYGHAAFAYYFVFDLIITNTHFCLNLINRTTITR